VVVVIAPQRQPAARFFERRKPFDVEAFIPQTPVEAFDEPVPLPPQLCTAEALPINANDKVGPISPDSCIWPEAVGSGGEGISQQ
jgi:hypothetical protein